MRKKHLLGWANYLTYARIVTIPLFVVLMSWITPAPGLPTAMDVCLNWLVTLFFILSGFTDVVDGYLARRGGDSGTFGKFLDPLADKLVTTAVLVMLIYLNRLPAWIAVVLISREITITALRGMAISEGLVIAASQWGKRKSLLEHFALSGLLIYYPMWGLNFHVMGLWLIYGTMIVSVASGVHYIWQFFAEVLEQQSNQKELFEEE